MKKNITKKKIILFAIVLVGIFSLVGIVFMYFSWQITGEVIQNLIIQNLTLDKEDSENLGEIPVFRFENETSFNEGIFTTSYYLKNEEDLNVEFRLETTCSAAKESKGCDYVEWWYEYKLLAKYENKEDKVMILASDVGLDSLGDFETMSFDAFIIHGYQPYIEIFLESKEGIIILSIKDYQNENFTLKDKEDWFNIEINNETIVLIRNESVYSDQYFESLKKCKEGVSEINKDSKILKFEIKVDNWAGEDESRIKKIMINDNQYESSGLEAGEQLDFDFKVRFPNIMNIDEYTITTQVLPK